MSELPTWSTEQNQNYANIALQRHVRKVIVLANEDWTFYKTMDVWGWMDNCLVQFVNITNYASSCAIKLNVS